MSPGTKATLTRLRDEVDSRRAQAQLARGLDVRDASEKEKLASMRQTLKGRDYTYDHKGQVGGREAACSGEVVCGGGVVGVQEVSEGGACSRVEGFERLVSQC